MGSSTWAICDKATGQAIWTSSDAKSLTRLLDELKLNLGDKFVLERYKEKYEGIS